MPDSGKRHGRYRQMVEATPIAMVLIDTAGRMEMMNPRAEQAFGYKCYEILGQQIEILLPERLRGKQDGAYPGFSGHEPRDLVAARRDCSALRKDGIEFPAEILLNPIETDDGTMILACITDISSRIAEENRFQAALREKDILLGEIHHRVKNNMQIIYSLLDLQSHRVSDPAAREILREGRNRIHSMALIHQTLYASNDFAKVDFATFIDTLLSSLCESFGVDPGRIEFRIDIEPIRLPIDTAVPCGLMANELITNALKHAFAGRDRGEIRVALTRLPGNEVLLSVSDDGRGLPDHIDIDKSETLGLQLVDQLARQLEGTVSINRANPTRFSVRFPV